MDIAVLSDGGWGTALALLLCKNGHKVKITHPHHPEITLDAPHKAYIQKLSNGNRGRTHAD